MVRLTNGQRSALEALCEAMVPAAQDNPTFRDLPHRVEIRLGDLSTYHYRRALLALRVFDSRLLSLLAAGKPVAFKNLNAADRSRLLDCCASHRIGLLRALFSSVRRLILNTHYSNPLAAAEIGYLGPIGMRTGERLFSWEGPLADGGPVVATAWREPAKRTVLPVGITRADARSPVATRARVCVIGSGVGGATTAAILAEAGHDVVVLEEGEYHAAADFSSDETAAMRTLYADGALRSTDELNVSILQARCAGGGSTINWMVMLRTPERVIEEWHSRHHTELTASEMRSAFDAFERSANVRPVPDGAHSPVNRIILDGARALGWSAHAASINARECMRAGACGFGCPYDAKQGMLKTQLPRALDAGARMYANARVERVERRAQGFRVHASGVDVDCDVVVVAAGATATPRLLQRSRLGGPVVGKHLRLHPTTAVIGVYDRDIYAAGGIPLSAYCDEFADLRDGYGHWIEAPPLSPGLAAVALPGFGHAHRAHMQQFPKLAPLIVLVRDGAPAGPSVGSVGDADDTRISYRLGAADREALLHGMESAARLHFACGAQSVLTLHGNGTMLQSESDLHLIRAANQRFGNPSLFSAHVNGTARMGGNAQTSACRPDGQVHDQPGLYVMDGSLLPTAPGVNPHETIAAVTSILAGRLAEALP